MFVLQCNHNFALGCLIDPFKAIFFCFHCWFSYRKNPLLPLAKSTFDSSIISCTINHSSYSPLQPLIPITKAVHHTFHHKYRFKPTHQHITLRLRPRPTTKNQITSNHTISNHITSNHTISNHTTLYYASFRPTPQHTLRRISSATLTTSTASGRAWLVRTTSSSTSLRNTPSPSLFAFFGSVS